MSEQMLHILAPARFDDVGAIVGDLIALRRLRDAIDDAIESGTGGTYLMQSDGEGYSLAVVQAKDMYPVCTAYAGEIAPRRSGRETVTIRGLPLFLDALQKSRPPVKAAFDIPRFLPNSDHGRMANGVK